jgi:hypothetical protein
MGSKQRFRWHFTLHPLAAVQRLCDTKTLPEDDAGHSLAQPVPELALAMLKESGTERRTCSKPIGRRPLTNQAGMAELADAADSKSAGA